MQPICRVVKGAKLVESGLPHKPTKPEHFFESHQAFKPILDKLLVSVATKKRLADSFIGVILFRLSSFDKQIKLAHNF